MIKSLSRKPGFALAVAVATAAPAVSAQEELEEVIVTGSRIPVDSNAISSVPIQSVTEEDIRNSGEINIADIVADIPALVSSTTAENSSTGANSLNLRGLGSARTLTLVNGRRHVAGFRGSQAVDVGTIPRALVKSVEVTTGGASAVYGADAVTGVVNFILRDDFEGLQIDMSAGRPEAGAGETTILDLSWGTNFAGGRGNAVVTFSAETDAGITAGQRSWSRDNGISTTLPNPDPNGPPRAVVDDPRFWLTSQEGSIAPGLDFDWDIDYPTRQLTYVDINGNGIPDCQESEGGREGFYAGCWLTNPDGTVRVNQDGTIIDGLYSTGGDGGRITFNRDSLYPKTDRQVVNFNLNYEFSDTLRGFLETKYVKAESETFSEIDGFFDTLEITQDNAFVPVELQGLFDLVDAAQGYPYLVFTKDPLDWSDNDPSEYTRETTRIVAGVEWQVADDHQIEFSVNHGTFTTESKSTTIMLDRFYAAMDSIIDENGNAVCRSDVEGAAFYPVDYFGASNFFTETGGYSSNQYYTFTPGDGQCQPLNPFGTYAASPEAQDFISTQVKSELEIEQLVLNMTAVGSFDVASSLLDGPLGYAAGVEYRDESSDDRLDPLLLGILPEGTSYTAGANVNDVSPWLYDLTSFDNTERLNTSGSYDVTDVFAEVRLPIMIDRAWAKELTVDAAVRVADYSTLGSATTWKLGATWAPNDQIRLRATSSEAVRAPNISELFDPLLAFPIGKSVDPCDRDEIGAGSDAREANCIAALTALGVSDETIFQVDPQRPECDGSIYCWRNPLSARFYGRSGGDPNLVEETADTQTIGLVLTPAILDGLVITVDYWDVTIEDAISAVGARDILNGCYDSNSYPNLDFCDSFERRADGGLSDLTTQTINYAKLEADGIDVSVAYGFDIGETAVNLRMAGSKQDALNRFFNPLDASDVNPGVMEIGVPKETATFNIGLDRGSLSVGVQAVYQSKQAVDSIERVLGLYGSQALYGDDGFFSSMVVTDINGRYQLNESASLFAAVNNVTDETPYSTQTAWPVGPRGRTFVLGFSYSM
ncbi:MAG TPA: outer membrane cobalamin receptor protein [Halieaceae bacterium]|nr:outer membrane cobalamin receptor protein [Halieaceae bacterium]